jgi:hypothetical protein
VGTRLLAFIPLLAGGTDEVGDGLGLLHGHAETLGVEPAVAHIAANHKLAGIIGLATDTVELAGVLVIMLYCVVVIVDDNRRLTSPLHAGRGTSSMAFSTVIITSLFIHNDMLRSRRRRYFQRSAITRKTV